MKRENSAKAWARAQETLAGGVNSPVRAFNAVGGTPVFFENAEGSRLIDVDGNSYIDYVGSWGAAVLGHSHPRVVEAIREQAGRAIGIGAPTRLESEMAEAVRARFPSMARLRFVNSGTEATMSAIRLARGHSGRKLVITFAGCYHGHADSFLGNAGSGLLTLDIREAAGVVPELSRHTLSQAYNDTATLRKVFAERGSEIAAVIVEPVAGNMSLIEPEPGFLEAIIELCRQHGAVSIFDEVMTGCRVHVDGAQGLYGLAPDMTTLGKVIGGGLPVGAFGGREELMNDLAPLGKVYQAGTLSGSPLAMRAGLETLKILGEPGYFAAIAERGASLATQLQDAAASCGIPFCARALGAMMGMQFLASPARNLEQIRQEGHQRAYRRLFHLMLDRGVYLAPSPFEAGFISAAHSEADIARTVEVFSDSLKEIAPESLAE